MVKLFKYAPLDASFEYARRMHLLWSPKIQKQICELFQFLHYSGKVEPQCQATPVEFGSSHEAICAGFVDICLPILHSF
jgi:hypothetical protein